MRQVVSHLVLEHGLRNGALEESRGIETVGVVEPLDRLLGPNAVLEGQIAGCDERMKL